MKTLLVLAILLLQGCGKTFVIDPAFNGLVNQWNNAYPNSFVNVTMRFGTLPNPQWVGLWDGTQVTIDPTFYNSSNADTQKQLVFHELGHAMFNYGHDWECVNINDFSQVVDCQVGEDAGASLSSFPVVPRSIMYPYVFGMDIFWSVFESYYINQLGSCETCTNFSNTTPDQIRQLTNRRQID